jgi:hypothetical protein
MSLKAHWAYAFNCGKTIEQILASFNEAGPWRWGQRDGAW